MKLELISPITACIKIPLYCLRVYESVQEIVMKEIGDGDDEDDKYCC